MERFMGINLTDEMRYQTPYANSTLFPLLLLSLAQQKHTADPKINFAAEYDYVVVGGGVGGSVVANRLSEIPDVTVLLLEAGGTPPLVTEIPAMSVLFARSDLTWNYWSTPQKHVGRAVNNGTIATSTGKVLGGGSTINGMINVRGNRQNYDQWACNGATGWSYEEVLPYFIKLEDNKNIEYLQNGYHGFGGPITVDNIRYDSEIRRAISEAGLSLGYEFVDVNGPRQTGLYDQQVTTRDAQRCSANKAYLVTAETRPNLDILTKALVTKIIIEDKRAVGVLFDYGCFSYEVRARKEVILSAGAYRTPQLLMLSGIGPRQELKKFDIPVIADLPVGSNLQNHWVTFMVYEINESVKKFTDALNEEENLLAYINYRIGPLTMPAGVYLMAFLNTYETKPVADNPDVNLLISDFLFEFAIDYFNFSSEDFQLQRNKNTLSCTVQNLNTKSIGKVSLKSKSPYDDPLIDFNALSDPQDVKDLARGLKLCRNLMSAPAMKNIGAKPLEGFVPECDKYAHEDDLYLQCYVRNIISEGVHVVGTAKMGSLEDPSTVVDPELRVKNIERLRVVDASVMPDVPWGNTYIPTAMIAEKASDMIKLALENERYFFK